MKRQIISLTVCLLMLCACATPEENAPFFWHFKMVSDDQFQYIAEGNVDFPANTESGEQARKDFLDGYLNRHNVCPNGYTILSRKPEPLFGRPDINKQRYRQITYTGQCHLKDNG